MILLQKKIYVYILELPARDSFLYVRRPGQLLMLNRLGIRCFYLSKRIYFTLLIGLASVILVLDKYMFISILNNIKSFFLNSVGYGFFFDLYVYGSGFCVTYFLSYLVLEMFIGCVNYLYIFRVMASFSLELSIICFAAGKCFLFFSQSKMVLYDFIAQLLLYKVPDIYKVTGIVYPRQIICLRQTRKEF